MWRRPMALHATFSLMLGALTDPVFITTATCIRTMYLFYWCYRNTKLIILKMLVVTIILSKGGKCSFYILFCTFACLVHFEFASSVQVGFFLLKFLNILPIVIPTKISSWSLLLLVQAGFKLCKNQDTGTGMPVK